MSCSTTSGAAMLGCCQGTPPVNAFIGLRLFGKAATSFPLSAAQSNGMMAAMRDYIMGIPDLFAWQNPWGVPTQLVVNAITGYELDAYTPVPPFNLAPPYAAGACTTDIEAQKPNFFFSAAGFFNPTPPTGVDYGPSVLRVDVRLASVQGLCLETRTGPTLNWQAALPCGIFSGATTQDSCGAIASASSYIIPVPDFQPGLAGQGRVTRLYTSGNLASPACCGFPP